MQNDDNLKHAADALSLITVLGTLVEALPAVAALLSIVWSVIRIYESDTFRKFLNFFKGPK